jgi:hypothetical protein
MKTGSQIKGLPALKKKELKNPLELDDKLLLHIKIWQPIPSTRK